MDNSIFESEELAEKISHPFVFISWKHDEKVQASIEKAVKHLEDKGINVVWDEGALVPNERLQRFQQLIFSINCYKVLVVSTKAYRDSCEDINTGCGMEYFYISDHYPENPKKYVAVTIDKNRKYITPLLNATISVDLSDFDGLAECCRLKGGESLADSNAKEYFELLYQMDIFADNYQYAEALKYAESISPQLENLRIPKSTKCRFLTTKLFCFISTRNEYAKVKEDVDDLYQLAFSSNYLSKETQAKALLNCALTYRFLNNKDKYLESAEKAADRAVKNRLPETYDYLMQFAVALYEADRMVEANRKMKEAYDSFMQSHNMEDLSDDEISKWIKLNETYAACSVGASNHCNKDNKKRWSLLAEAEERMCGLLYEYKISDYLVDSEIFEVYKTVTSLFESLRNLYKKRK